MFDKTLLLLPSSSNQSQYFDEKTKLQKEKGEEGVSKHFFVSTYSDRFVSSNPICYDKQTLFLLFCYLEKLTITLAFNIISIQHSSLLRKIIMLSQIKM
jgi:hypothetical protein